jgi:hypothetical protein
MRPDDPDTTPEPDDEISTRFPSEPRAREMREGRNGGKLIVSVPGQPGYPGAGRPSKQALFRERFEDEFDEWFAVLTRARDGKDGPLRLTRSRSWRTAPTAAVRSRSASSRWTANYPATRWRWNDGDGDGQHAERAGRPDSGSLRGTQARTPSRTRPQRQLDPGVGAAGDRTGVRRA